MKKYLAIGLALGLLIWSLGSLSSAQEEEEIEYSWGTVSSVSSNEVVVTEYDYDTDKEINVAYIIDPAAELKGVGSLKDIAAGDSVDIDYVVKDGKNIAKVITVEKPSLEEPYPEEESKEEEPYLEEEE